MASTGQIEAEQLKERAEAAEVALAEAREAWGEVRSYCVAGTGLDHEVSCEAMRPYQGECDCFVPALDTALAATPTKPGEGE